MPDEQLIAQMEAKIAERPDLIERLHCGDTGALFDIFEVVDVRAHRPDG